MKQARMDIASLMFSTMHYSVCRNVHYVNDKKALHSIKTNTPIACNQCHNNDGNIVNDKKTFYNNFKSFGMNVNI